MTDLKILINSYYKGFKEFSELISIIVNSFLLTLVYFLGVGPTNLFAKLRAKEFLMLKINKADTTYWSELNLKQKEFEEYYNQF